MGGKFWIFLSEGLYCFLQGSYPFISLGFGICLHSEHRVLLCLCALEKVYLEVPDLLVIGGDACGPVLTQIDHLLGSALFVAPLQKMSLEVEIPLLVSVEVAFLLKEALDGDLSVVHCDLLLERLRVSTTELRGKIVLLVLGVRRQFSVGPASPASRIVNIKTHL